MDCLLTKLKASVNNDALRLFDGVRIELEPHTDGNPVKGYINFLAATKAYLRGDGQFTNSSGTPIGKVMDISGGLVEFCTTPEGGILEFEGRSFVDSIEMFDYTSMDLAEVTYLDNMVDLKVTKPFGDISSLNPEIMRSLSYLSLYKASELTGDISSLKDFTTLTSLYATQLYNVTGNIAILGKLTSLTFMQLADSQIYGSLESFVAAQRSNGRTTCDGINLALFATSPHVTWRGEAIPWVGGDETIILSWTASTITFNGETITA